jgi:seryl-tRNA synthetase
MLDPKLLRNNIAFVTQELLRRGFALDIDEYQSLEADRRSLQAETENLQNERNVKSKLIGQAKAKGEDVSPLLAEVSGLGEKLDLAKKRFGEVREQLEQLLKSVPNLPDASVPEGEDESGNITLRECGSPRVFDFKPLDHVDLGDGKGLDFETAVKVSGSRYVIMTGELAKLQRALTQYMLDIHTSQHGYTEVYVPYIVNSDSLFGTGQLPKFAEDQFQVAGDAASYLIPTAEVPVTNIYRDVILDESELPKLHVCHSPCFRSEAGSYGRDTRGMIRQHQFEKVEMVQIVHPSRSWEAFDMLTSHAEAILQNLGLPYRAVNLCGGDLGFSSAKTVDLEVWLPSQNEYREISSCSNFLDFQARRMQARFRTASGSVELVHTLNGSGLAVGRTLVAVLENYQNSDGSISVPDVLRTYLDGKESILVS